MNEITKTIYDLELSLLKPDVRSSFDQLDLLLADDFMEFGSSGLKYDKKEILDRLPKNTNKVTYTVSDFAVTLLSDNIALATFKTERVLNDIDRVVSLRSSLWRKMDQSWQIFFHQGTPVKEG
jgi:hypothetical protein